MALTTRMVEISLFLGILVGSCIITGSLIDGFIVTCSEFLVGALADEGHVYIILFTVILSGAVGMMVRCSVTYIVLHCIALYCIPYKLVAAVFIHATMVMFYFNVVAYTVFLPSFFYFYSSSSLLYYYYSKNLVVC
jgi:hypothetical protein